MVFFAAKTVSTRTIYIGCAILMINNSTWMRQLPHVSGRRDKNGIVKMEVRVINPEIKLEQKRIHRIDAASTHLSDE